MSSAKETQAIDARVKCENCKRSSNMADTITTRPVFGIANTNEIGIRCPYCKHYRRAYWDNPGLAHYRAKLKEASLWLGTEAGQTNYRKAKARYGAEFERLQAQVAQHLGQPAVNAEDHLGAEIAIKIAETKEEAQV